VAESREAQEPRQRRAVRALRAVDSDPRLVGIAGAVRRRLPGDPDYGDRLSVAGSDPRALLSRQLATLDGERASVLREVGLGAMQAWQALAEKSGRGHGDRELAVVFTDLVGWSSWALDAGDTMAVELLRAVGEAVEPAFTDRGGRVVKRMGDGLMAVFLDVPAAVDAALDASDAVGRLDVGGHRPRMRAGVHVGRPRKLGGDYLGVDVNVAARIMAAADPGQVLVSDAALAHLDEEELRTKRRRFFRAKGTPSDLKVHAVRRRD
jgi:adenylate cyclase